MAGTWIPGNCVRFEAVSVCRIAAEYPLVWYKSAFRHQVGGDGQTAFVLEIAICNNGTVNLRFKQAQFHVGDANADLRLREFHD